MFFYDTNDVQMLSVNFAMGPNTSQIITVRVECVTGYKLKSVPNSTFVVQARKQGDTTWIDIETTPIDLTTYAGFRQNFEIQITSGAVTQFQEIAIPFTVSV